MRITKLTIKNFTCFRGEQTLDLEAKVYAVTARHLDNEKRSNWLGKTTFLEIIDFIIRGEHRYPKEDMWITRGEADGFAQFETDTNLTIRRERIRGESTILTVTDGDQVLRKVEAEARIAQLLCLAKDDFENTSYFKQRMMSRFITAQPTVRMEIMSSWFKLGPLQRCEARVRSMARERLDQVVLLQQTIAGRKTYIDQTYASVCPDYPGHDQDSAAMVTGFNHTEADLEQAACVRQQELDALTEKMEAHQIAKAEWHALQSNATEFERLRQKGIAIKAESDALTKEMCDSPAADETQLSALLEEVSRTGKLATEAASVLAAANTEARQKKQLAAGCFDGKCPVNMGTCPITEEINAPRRRNLVLLTAAQEAQHAADTAHAVLVAANIQAGSRYRLEQERAREYARKQNRVGQITEQLVELHVQCTRLLPSRKLALEASAPEGEATIRADIQTARAGLLEAQTGLRYVTQGRTTITEAITAIGVLEGQLVTALAESQVAQEAVQVFGRNGAQKRVAEGALADIEAGANGLLQACGIDLTLGVQWAREGDGLATDCEFCGTVFPTSQKIKTCAKCHAARGPKLVNKLEIVLSDRSGAAEDLAGIAFQLSASAWLRNDRGSLWGTCLIDEPFGAMDEANRQAMAVHFATMLKGAYGYEQAFVVAHNRDIMDSLPARIEITADSNGSKLRVIG